LVKARARREASGETKIAVLTEIGEEVARAAAVAASAIVRVVKVLAEGPGMIQRVAQILAIGSPRIDRLEAAMIVVATIALAEMVVALEVVVIVLHVGTTDVNERTQRPGKTTTGALVPVATSQSGTETAVTVEAIETMASGVAVTVVAMMDPVAAAFGIAELPTMTTTPTGVTAQLDKTTETIETTVILGHRSGRN